MARPVSCSPLAFILILIFFIYPVAADGSGSPVVLSTPGPTESPLPYTIQMFIPTASMIHSAQVMDQINGPNGEDILFATAFGLSRYNGTWETRHIDLNNISAGLMDDYVTATEYDADGNLWLGYSGGIQIYNGRDYRTIRDQQILKDLRINDLQRWGDDMWVATGNAAIHRYHAGTWTWFQPMTPGGPGFYEIDSMVVDPASNAMVIATRNEGLWIIRSPADPIRFEMLAGKNTPYGQMDHIRRDPQGGVYFFDKSSIVHYGADTGFVPVLANTDLAPFGIGINDVSAGPDGNLFIATDDGLFIWKNNVVYRHLTRFEGIGTSPAVRTVFVDTLNRAWFSTPGYVGYYADLAPENYINIELVTPVPDQSQVQTPPQEIPPAGTLERIPATPASSPPGTGTKNSSVFDPIIGIINTISGLFGIKIIS